jgi:hypothetical protein
VKTPVRLPRLPGQFQGEALLRVHAERLARRDAEERRVEAGHVVQEAAGAGVHAAVRGAQRRQVPAAVLREVRDRVGAFGDETPQVLGRGDPARVAAGHADDGDGLLRVGRTRHGDLGLAGAGRSQLGVEEAGHRARVRLVEDQRGRQPQPGRGVQLVAQLGGGQRVEAELGERTVRGDLVG